MLMTAVLGLLEWVMHVMVFVRNGPRPLKRPRPLKTAPGLRGPCHLIALLHQERELPKLNSAFISPGFLRYSPSVSGMFMSLQGSAFTLNV